MGRVIIRKTPKGGAERMAPALLFPATPGQPPARRRHWGQGYPLQAAKMYIFAMLAKTMPGGLANSPRFRRTKSRLFEEAPKERNNDGALEVGSPEQTADMGEKPDCDGKSPTKRAIRMETER